MPKPQITGRQRLFSDIGRRYHAWRDSVHLLCPEILIDPGHTLIFFFTPPKSWSRKKREAMLFQPHVVRPDVDNLIKAMLDAAHREDMHVWDVRGVKVYAEQEGTLLIPGPPFTREALEAAFLDRPAQPPLSDPRSFRLTGQ